VRLLHGDFTQCKVYAMDAASLADTYADEGAQWLHVVDLAASRDGQKADIQPLLNLLGKAKQAVQTGGGVREKTDIRLRLDHGAERVVIGSLSVTEPEAFCGWLKEFGTAPLGRARTAGPGVRNERFGNCWTFTRTRD
jgi:phosphoribosylformimino-5-aminoimidazole carboxamide ribotide isomerase